MNDSSLIKCAAAFLGGAAIGVATGILFAPAKGTITRRRISRTSQHAVDTVKDKFENIKESVEDLMEEIEGAAEHTMKKVRR